MQVYVLENRETWHVIPDPHVSLPKRKFMYSTKTTQSVKLNYGGGLLYRTSFQVQNDLPVSSQELHRDPYLIAHAEKTSLAKIRQ